MADTIIQFDRVCKSFDGHPVLREFSLCVQRGAFLTIIGRSGCGKTTALRLVNGLICADSGRVLVHGRDVADADPVALRRGIGYTIQNVGLFPHMTVEKNIAYVPAISNSPSGRGRSGAAGRRSCCKARGWSPAWPAAIPGSCPAGSASGWALPGRWPPSRTSC